ncbi:outer membrane protein assembly factor BamC [Teredinibacter turnerae]|uniref:outer membrane protein assembly factor BamC n=1 Tax=Teredinibacter turnerae TaxID=2426 RepID=UPI0005F82933|nr:outer membrane protein assembly factor BamC [Teredinibacter turnerae]
MNLNRTTTAVRLLVLVSLVNLVGCSTFFGKHGVFRGRGSDYLQSGSIEPIELPADMESVPLEPLYPIPSVRSTDAFGDPVSLDEYKVPRPLALGEKGEVGVKIQKLEGDRWIYLNASTAQVWPRTQYFLNSGVLDVARSNPAQGIIETAWVGFKDDQTTAVRYRIRLEKGIHPETTEIHVLEQQVERAVLEGGEQPDWPATSDSEEREEWLLRELANSLAETVDNNAASLLGQNVGGNLKAGFTRFNGEPTLVIHVPKVRAWATLSHAANEEGFKVWDDSVEAGVIYAGYTTYDEDEAGFFHPLAFWSDEQPLPKKAPYTLTELMSNLNDGAEVKAKFGDRPGAGFGNTKLKHKAQGFLIVMTYQESKALVNIRDYRGKRISDEDAKHLLAILRKNLI